MILIVVIDLLVVGLLIRIATSRGLEQALPFLAFTFTLIPERLLYQFQGCLI